MWGPLQQIDLTVHNFPPTTPTGISFVSQHASGKFDVSMAVWLSLSTKLIIADNSKKKFQAGAMAVVLSCDWANGGKWVSRYVSNAVFLRSKQSTICKECSALCFTFL